MKCCVCETTKNVKLYGSTEIPLCKEHGKGMIESGATRCEHGNGYFGYSTGGGIRVTRSGKPES